MRKFKVDFTLKQHTPIIHFQSEQRGATLRATELKPKFDRFLLENVFDGEIPKGFLMQNEEHALDYKVRIYNEANVISTPKSYVNPKKERDKTAYQAPYFADESKSVFATGEITIEFFTFNNELRKIIDQYKDQFFIYENFGTRQNKGFGSFLRSNISNAEIIKILQNHKNQVFTLGKYTDYKDAFKKIDTFYKKIKAGINKPYFKSLLFRYMCDTYNIGWEKKFIKKHFPEVIHGEHEPIICTDDKEYRYIRAVLGLAEHNEFRPESGKKQIKIKSSDGSIERFKSPITFKVFNNQIYLFFNDSYKQILDKEFKFNGRMIKTPKEFDLYQFLKYVEKQENLIHEVK